MHPLAHIMYCVYNIYIYIIYISVCVHVCNKILGEKEIERGRERERETLQSLLKFWRCFRCYFGTGIS